MDIAAWQLYIALGLLCLAAEIFVPGFVMAPIGLAALVTALFALAVSSWPLQLLVWALVSFATYLSLVRMARSRLARGRDKAVLGLQGQEGTLLEACVSREQPGKVQVYGDIWDVSWDDLSAPEEAQLRSLPPGARVRVERVLGNRIIIVPIH